MALLQEMEYFEIWTFTSGVRASSDSTVLKANYYVISGNFICLSFHKYIIKDTFLLIIIYKCYFVTCKKLHYLTDQFPCFIYCHIYLIKACRINEGWTV